MTLREFFQSQLRKVQNVRTVTREQARELYRWVRSQTRRWPKEQHSSFFRKAS